MYLSIYLPISQAFIPLMGDNQDKVCHGDITLPSPSAPCLFVASIQRRGLPDPSLINDIPLIMLGKYISIV